MPRTCLACQSPRREEIDAALVTGEPLRNIAKHVSISVTAIYRHKEHVGAAIVKAQERRGERHEDNLHTQIGRVQAKLWAMLAKMEAEGDHRGAVVALREIRESLEAIDRMMTRAQGSPSEQDFNSRIREGIREGHKRAEEERERERLASAQPLPNGCEHP
jgi:hypothetical protein